MISPILAAAIEKRRELLRDGVPLDEVNRVWREMTSAEIDRVEREALTLERDNHAMNRRVSRPTGPTPPLVEWPLLGHFDPPPRIHRHGEGYQYGATCPRCHATAHHKAMATSWRQRDILAGWRCGDPVRYHCTRCRVRWTQPYWPTATFYPRRSPVTWWDEITSRRTLEAMASTSR